MSDSTYAPGLEPYRLPCRSAVPAINGLGTALRHSYIFSIFDI